MDCVFCKIVAGEIPSHTIYEDDNHLAFLTIFPNTEGFSVVIPKTHQPSNFAQASEDVVLQLTATARKVAQQITAAYSDVERCAAVYEGYGVNHLHAKLIPLHGTAGKDWQPHNMNSDVYFDQYEGYISTHEPKDMADHKQLAKVAAKIRGGSA